MCLAGGVALNCVANGILVRSKLFDNIWVQPASGDAGGALGAALSVWHLHYEKKRIISERKDMMKGSYLGLASLKKLLKKIFKDVVQNSTSLMIRN